MITTMSKAPYILSTDHMINLTPWVKFIIWSVTTMSKAPYILSTDHMINLTHGVQLTSYTTKLEPHMLLITTIPQFHTTKPRRQLTPLKKTFLNYTSMTLHQYLRLFGEFVKDVQLLKNVVRNGFGIMKELKSTYDLNSILIVTLTFRISC